MTEPILTPFLGSQDITVYQGDCIEVMARMPEASVDTIITDPPYGLEFMGKSWDSFAPDGDRPKRSGWDSENTGATINREDKSTPHGRTGVAFGKRRKTYKCADCGKRDAFRNEHGCSGAWEHEWVHALPVQALAFQEFSRAWATEALRILKPGGHLIAFGGTRTYHRLAAGIEDAGFEIRDCVAWLYGSGFPKSLDVSKAIDKAAGAEREVVGKWKPTGNARPSNVPDHGAAVSNTTQQRAFRDEELPITVPATANAEKWQGWGTALKPAFEPIVLARKPLIGTVAANVLEHGTGALNIDKCRIGTDVVKWQGDGRDGDSPTAGASRGGMSGGYNYADGDARPVSGRWPANVTLDEEAAAMLDEQSGERPGFASQRRLSPAKPGMFGVGHGSETKPIHDGYDDKGGASRFFYCAKASKKDRNTNGADNHHPTVKPTALMRWLIRLATPPGGIILDPFGGSGSTGVAARAEGVRAILIEREDEYLDIIRQRLDEGPLFGNLD